MRYLTSFSNSFNVSVLENGAFAVRDRHIVIYKSKNYSRASKLVRQFTMDCPDWMQEVWAKPNLVAIVEDGSIEDRTVTLNGHVESYTCLRVDISKYNKALRACRMPHLTLDLLISYAYKQVCKTESGTTFHINGTRYKHVPVLTSKDYREFILGNTAPIEGEYLDKRICTERIHYKVNLQQRTAVATIIHTMDTPKAVKRCSEVVLEYDLGMPGYGKYSAVYVDELIHRFTEEVAYQKLRITHIYFMESFIEDGQLKYKYKVLLDNGDSCILTRNNKL